MTQNHPEGDDSEEDFNLISNLTDCFQDQLPQDIDIQSSMLVNFNNNFDKAITEVKQGLNQYLKVYEVMNQSSQFSIDEKNHQSLIKNHISFFNRVSINLNVLTKQLREFYLYGNKQGKLLKRKNKQLLPLSSASTVNKFGTRSKNNNNNDCGHYDIAHKAGGKCKNCYSRWLYYVKKIETRLKREQQEIQTDLP